jgi:hypothetical protein
MGGGSGEFPVSWDSITDATGYRVYRSTSPDGPFTPSASFNVATGETTIEIGIPYEYIGIWPTSDSSYEYVEAVWSGTPIYFRVAAFNAGGAGPLSVVVCSTPPRPREGPDECAPSP